MEYRNAQYNQFGTIDCEVNHADYGWIPITASQDDPNTNGLFNQLSKATDVLQYVPPSTEVLISEKITEYENLLQNHLDKTAQSKGYDSIISACSYAGYTNPYQAESQSFIAWRGAFWAESYNLIPNYNLENIPTIEELIALLPKFEEF
jgi:hypothetical protein